MRHIYFTALALGGLAGAAAWAAPQTIVEASSPPVRVASPVEGRVLPAGSLAVLEWLPLDAYESLGAQEWEAFLSLDGGAHYPLRITPHLDSDLQRVLWQVPATPTRNGRLLLRFGDERSETSFEVPGQFEISAPAAALPFYPWNAASSSLGEPARAGDRGVVVWVEGSRRGGSLRQVVATSSGLVPYHRPTELVPGEFALLGEPDPDSAPQIEPALQGRSPISQSGVRKAASRLAPRAAIPILLLVGRQNE